MCNTACFSETYADQFSVNFPPPLHSLAYQYNFLLWRSWNFQHISCRKVSVSSNFSQLDSALTLFVISVHRFINMSVLSMLGGKTICAFFRRRIYPCIAHSIHGVHCIVLYLHACYCSPVQFVNIFMNSICDYVSCRTITLNKRQWIFRISVKKNENRSIFDEITVK